MKDKKKNEGGAKKSKEGQLFRRWKDPAKNQMGNDISSEIKIANSDGKMEGGKDKRWHLNEE